MIVNFSLTRSSDDLKLHLEIGNHSDVGRVRERNEDYYGSFSGTFGNLLVVCDGMGGHKGGEIASRLAVETLKNHFEKLPAEFNPAEEIRNALGEANDSIISTAERDASLSDMGSTVVLVLILNDLAYCASLGDSRIYLITEEGIRRFTKDHSLVQQMIDSKMITEEEAKDHPKKNVITRALGIDESLEPDIHDPLELKDGYKLVLCTDGLTSNVSEKEILETVVNNSPQQASQKLIDLSNQRGGGDNITVQVASLSSKKPVAQTQKKPGGNFLMYSVLAVAIIALALVFIKFEVISFGKESTKTIENKVSTSPKKIESKDNSDPAINKVKKDSMVHLIVKPDSIKQQNEEEINHDQPND